MTRLTRWNPLWDWNMTPMLRLSTPSRAATNAYLPPMDIEEEEGQYLVTLSVPGFSQDQLEISLDDEVLHIQGSVTSENGSDEGVADRKYHLRERHMNRFSRSLRLPSGIEADKIGAKYDNGVLTLTIQKLEEVLPKQIEIAVS